MTATDHLDAPPAYEASLQHLELLHRKIVQLEQARTEAEEQFCTSVGRAYAQGAVTDDALALVYLDFRAAAGPGFTKRWDEAVALTSYQANLITGSNGRYTPNAPEGAWHGVWPMDYDDPRPRKGKSVVYLLFDDGNVPCYVGSTANFGERMKRHAKDGKPVAAWRAVGTHSRADAYATETAWLQSYKPYLNKRAYA